jgi:hypothetical protein
MERQNKQAATLEQVAHFLRLFVQEVGGGNLLKALTVMKIAIFQMSVFSPRFAFPVTLLCSMHVAML